MVYSEVQLTKEDVERSHWQDIIASASPKEVSHYASLFFAESDKAHAHDDVALAALFSLLGTLASLMLQPEKTKVKRPFAPVAVWADGTTSPTLDDLSENHWDMLTSIVTDIEDPEMRARIADALWVGKRNHDAAKKAIAAYLESARTLEDPTSWVAPMQRIERALRLAAHIGDQQAIKSIIAYVEGVLTRLRGNDPLYFSSTLMELLLEFKAGDPATYEPLAEAAAKRAEAEQDWRRARQYWDVVARWRGRATDQQGKRAALLASAETYVKEANALLNQAEPAHYAASVHLRDAIQAFRQIGGARDKVDELHGKLLDCQAIAASSMKRITVKLDVTDLAGKIRALVSGKSLPEALITLAGLGKSPSVAELRASVKADARNFPLRHLASAEVVTEAGKVAGHRGSNFPSDVDEAELAMRYEMWRKAQEFQLVRALGVIQPAQEQINMEHAPRLSDLLRLVAHNPFVPRGRELLYARGLLAGLDGDYVVAASLLIPQVENSLRYVLSQQDIVVSKFNEYGIQNEIDLQEVFYAHRDALREAFDEDTVFDLQGLLIERFGSNLRNRQAHGLIDYYSLQSTTSVYLWWLTLRLCVYTLYRAHSPQPSAPADESAVSDPEYPVSEEVPSATEEDMASAGQMPSAVRDSSQQVDDNREK